MNNTKTTTFQEYIKTRKKFYIALYQRKFVWDTKKIDEFIDEIVEAYTEQETTSEGVNNRIFCGTIYIKNTKDVDKGWEIIDGQQRTTFLYIFSKWTNDKIDESIKAFREIENPTLKDENNLTLLINLKNSLSEFNIDVEREEVDISEKIGKRNNKVGKNFHHLKEYIDNEIYPNSFNNNKIDLSKFILFFWNNLDIIEIDVMDKYQINDVFKSINSKGKKLSEWDIIRNEIFRTIEPIDDLDSKTMLEYIDQYFVIIEEGNIKKEEFIRAYLMHKIGDYVKKNELSSKFEESIKNNTFSSNDFYTFVKEFVNNFKELDDKTIIDDASINEFRWFHKIISEFKATQVKVFALFCMFNWSGAEIPYKINSVLIKLFVNFVIHVSVNEHRGNVFEKFFQKNASTIIDLDPEEIEEVIDEYGIFEDNIKSLEDMKPKIYENKEMLKLYVWISAPETDKNTFFKILNHQYEHVLPRKFKEHWLKDENWKNITEDEINNNYLNKIGNIILLHKSLNIPSSNKEFKVKYRSYTDDSTTAKSHYFAQTYDKQLEKYEFIKPLIIANKEIWTPEIIETRTENISDEICYRLEEIISNAINPVYSKTNRIFKTKNDNDVVMGLKGIITDNEISLKEIYKEMFNIFEEDINNKRWESITNFNSVIRRNLQENTKDSKNLKYTPIFERVKIGVYKKIGDN